MITKEKKMIDAEKFTINSKNRVSTGIRQVSLQ